MLTLSRMMNDILKPRPRIILKSIFFSILMLIISFLSLNINLRIESDYIVLKILAMPANIAFIYSYFADNTAFYVICLIEFFIFAITFSMLLHFYYVIKRERNKNS